MQEKRRKKRKKSMKISQINETSYHVSDTNHGYLNALRRIMGSEVPTMAISKVEFKENSSALYDEIIAHRLGLIPLKTDLKTYNIPKKGEEESAATHTTLTLNVEGPCNVYAKDLVPKDTQIKPVHENTLIVKLLQGQKVELIATANLGQGKEHMKWGPGLITFYYKPKITVNNKSQDLDEFIDKYPPQVITDSKIDEKKINSAQLIDACKGINEDIVKIEYDEDHKDFILNIESWGQLSNKEIIEKGLEIFNNKIDMFEKELENI
jgi:DNA-directed RNA polymerase subunit D